MTQIKVKAADSRVPVRLMDLSDWIGADEPVSVPSHPYYLQALADGDLVLVTENNQGGE